MSGLRFTAAEKAAEARRELALRKRVYPRAVANRKLDVRTAERQMAIMLQIAEDYEQAARAEAPGLFEESTG